MTKTADAPMKTIELPKIVSREEWLVARKALLAKERAGVGCRISTAKVTTGSATTIDTSMMGGLDTVGRE